MESLAAARRASTILYSLLSFRRTPAEIPPPRWCTCAALTCAANHRSNLTELFSWNVTLNREEERKTLFLSGVGAHGAKDRLEFLHVSAGVIWRPAFRHLFRPSQTPKYKEKKEGMAVGNKHVLRNSLPLELETKSTKLKSLSLPRQNDLNNRVKQETNTKAPRFKNRLCLQCPAIGR